MGGGCREWSKFRHVLAMGTASGRRRRVRAIRGASACAPAWSALYTSSLVSCARSASLKSLTAGQFTGSVVRSGTGAAGPFLSARRAARIFRRSLRAVASETAP